MIRSGGIKKLSVAAAMFLAACSGEQSGHRFEAGNFGGVESQTFGLIATACTYSGTGNVDMNLTVNAGEVLYVYYRPTDSKVVASGVDANGADCATTAAGRILIDDGTAGVQKVIIDYVNAPAALFAVGTATNPGVDIDLGDEAGDTVTIRGTTGNDTYMFGRTSTGTGISANVNNDTNDDIIFNTITVNTSVIVTTGDGVDTVSGVGSMATGGVCATCGFPAPLTVYAGNGNDVLTSGAAIAGLVNTLNGEGDDDTFTQQAAFAADVINGGAGTDTVSYAVRTTAISVTIDAVADDGDVAANAAAGEDDTVAADIENVTGGAGSDTINALADVDNHVFIGNAGNDTLIGSDGADTLTGGTGDDILMGRLGADTMTGDAGSDTISFAHADHVAGVTVNLSLTPSTSTTADVFNTVMAAHDIENVRGSAGPDTITGGDENNIIWGGLGVDTLSGGDGDDAVHGEGGADMSVAGGNGDDVVSGGDGVDVSVTGGAGDDIVDALDSGGGADDASVTCGAGNDIAIDDALDSNINVDCELVQ
jgi:hypothetical protein